MKNIDNYQNVLIEPVTLLGYTFSGNDLASILKAAGLGLAVEPPVPSLLQLAPAFPASENPGSSKPKTKRYLIFKLWTVVCERFVSTSQDGYKKLLKCKLLK